MNKQQNITFGEVLENIQNDTNSAFDFINVEAFMKMLKKTPQGLENLFPAEPGFSPRLEEKVVKSFALKNAGLLKESKRCGCYYCCRIYSPEEIIEWIEEKHSRVLTAVCPKCGVDAVLPEHAKAVPFISPETLRQLNAQSF